MVEQGEIVERGTHEQLYAAHNRYYDLYTKQHGLETNLFLAPGEGDSAVPAPELSSDNGREPSAADALRAVQGELR